MQTMTRRAEIFCGRKDQSFYFVVANEVRPFFIRGYGHGQTRAFVLSIEKNLICHTSID
jgi:hypothetical protein